MTDDMKAEILAEISALAEKPKRQPGDVSISDLREQWGVQDATVKSWMKKYVDNGQYESMMVYDPQVGRSCRVYRKVKTENS